MEIRVTGQELVTEKNETLHIAYWLIGGGEKGYGIRIAVEPGGEQAEVRELSTQQEEVEALLGRMARCQVTPVTLADVAYDWLCERTSL